LLAEPEALLFRRVAVFAGGYTLQAIEQVCNADHGLGTEATDVVDLVTSLVEKSLLALDSDANDEPRYSMLETIREYAQEKLEESGEIEANRQQYVGYFLRLVEQAEPELRGPNQNVWLERLQRDHRNLCAALEGITETGQTELLLKVAPTLGQFWTRCGHWALGREQLEALLAEPRVLWQPSDKARTLYPLAYMAYLQGDYPYALACLEESLSLFRQEADGAGIADSLNLMGFVISMQGDKERARRLHAEGLDVARAAEYRLGVPFALYGIALIDIHAGNTASAHALTQESYIESRKIGDLLGIAYSLYSMGLADWLEGNYSEAREHCQESLRIHRQIQDKRGMALSLQVLGHISGQEGDVDDVNTRDRYLKESLSLLSKVGLRRYVPGTLAGLAMVALEQGDLAAAARLLGAADSSAKAAGAHVVPGQQPMQEAAIRRLLRTRDKAQMAEAWAEGEALSFQEVVALALDRPRPRI
jgi:tetratricopeptide (TPR) repeat protein